MEWNNEWGGKSVLKPTFFPHINMLIMKQQEKKVFIHMPSEHLFVKGKIPTYASVQFSSVQSCPTLCDPMNRSTPGLPVHHQLPEFTQTHVHWVGDAIQPSQMLKWL